MVEEQADLLLLRWQKMMLMHWKAAMQGVILKPEQQLKKYQGYKNIGVDMVAMKLESKESSAPLRE
jgi:hypothetical protein